MYDFLFNLEYISYPVGKATDFLRSKIVVTVWRQTDAHQASNVLSKQIPFYHNKFCMVIPFQ